MQVMYPTAYIDFITSRESNTPSKSGLYMESIGTFSRETIADIITGGWDVDSYISSKYAAACVESETDVLAILQANNAQFQTVNKQHRLMNFTNDTNAALSFPVGLKVAKSDKTPYSRLKIDKIYIKVANSGQIDVSIRDESFGTIQPYTVQCVAGVEAEINANIELDGSTFYVTIDTPNVTTYQSLAANNKPCEHIKKDANSLLTVVGFNGNSSNSVGYGVRIVAGLQCSILPIMVELLPTIKQAILYKGSELIQWDLINSQRTNATTIFNDIEQAQQLAYVWRGKATQILNVAVKNSIAALRQREHFCFACKPSLMQIVSRF